MYIYIYIHKYIYYELTCIRCLVTLIERCVSSLLGFMPVSWWWWRRITREDGDDDKKDEGDDDKTSE